MSPEWKAFLHHALHEADRLKITVGINLCDGWDCGGPWITKDQANKRLVYSEVQVDGPAKKEPDIAAAAGQGRLLPRRGRGGLPR